LADCAHGPGATGTTLPTTATESRLHGLELESGSHASPLDTFRRDLAIAKKALAQGHAPHMQTFELQRGQAFADDQLGAATADVSNQSLARLGGHGMGDTGVDEAGLFHARDDFDGMT